MSPEGGGGAGAGRAVTPEEAAARGSKWMTERDEMGIDPETRVEMLFVDLIDYFIAPREVYVERDAGSTQAEYDTKKDLQMRHLWVLLVARDNADLPGGVDIAGGNPRGDVILRTTYRDVMSFADRESEETELRDFHGLLAYCRILEASSAAEVGNLPDLSMLKLRPGQRCWSFR